MYNLTQQENENNEGSMWTNKFPTI